jgi:hypothetical protein
MGTTGPLYLDQLTRGETLEEVCVGPSADINKRAQQFGKQVRQITLNEEPVQS